MSIPAGAVWEIRPGGEAASGFVPRQQAETVGVTVIAPDQVRGPFTAADVGEIFMMNLDFDGNLIPLDWPPPNARGYYVIRSVTEGTATLRCFYGSYPAAGQDGEGRIGGPLK